MESLAESGDERVDPDALIDAGAVASLLGLPERWIRDNTRSGKIPHYSLGRYKRYRRSDVLTWLESQSGERA
jgi:excisionase family DNA binding protein